MVVYTLCTETFTSFPQGCVRGQNQQERRFTNKDQRIVAKNVGVSAQAGLYNGSRGWREVLSGCSPGVLEGGGGKLQREQLGPADKARADNSVRFYPRYRTPQDDNRNQDIVSFDTDN